MRYYNGDDVLQDYTRAVELLKQASEKGSAKADGELAFIYWGGRANQQRDRAKAIAYANKSGNHKTQLAHQVLGLSYLFGEENIQQQNFELAYSELSNATDYFYCGFLVGLMRYHGVGTKEDKKGAAEVFFSICKTKIKQEIVGMAALCLGYMYVQGEGVGKNMSEGVSWMKWGIKASKRDFLNDFYKMAEGAATYETYKGMRGIAQRYGSSDISFPDKWPGPDGDGGMDLPEKALKLYFDEQLFR
jgi:TPR repeat protein